MTFSSDLSLNKHVASACSSGFYWLCQLQCVRRSLDIRLHKDTHPCLHCLTCGLWYCNAILAGSPWYITNKLQHLMNTVACPVTDRLKFDHDLSQLLHDGLQWLDVLERIQYKIGITVHHCLQSKAPKYLSNCCTPVSDIASWRYLRSPSQHHLSVLYHVTGSAALVVEPFCCRPIGLELSARQCARPGCQQQLLQITTQDGLL